MSARLLDIARRLGATRRRLEQWTERLAAARAGAHGDPHADEVTPPPAPLLHSIGAGALDDVELTFEVLDTEDPGREGH
jgi:hypothetical protein